MEGLSVDGSQDQVVARPMKGRITTFPDVASGNEEDNSQAEELSTSAAVAGSRVKQIPITFEMDTSMKKDPEQKPSHTDVSRFRLANQRKEQRLRKMS